MSSAPTLPTTFGSGGSHISAILRARLAQVLAFQVCPLATGAGVSQGTYASYSVSDGAGATLAYRARLRGEHGTQLYIHTIRRTAIVADVSRPVFDLYCYATRAAIGSCTADAGADTLSTASAHGVSTKDPVRLANSGGALPGGLNDAQMYFAIVVNATTLKLASSIGNAVVGTAENIFTAGTGTHTLYRMMSEEFPVCSMTVTDPRYVETLVNGVSDFLVVTDLVSGNIDPRPLDTIPVQVGQGTPGAGEVTLSPGSYRRNDNIVSIYNLTDHVMIPLEDVDVVDMNKLVVNAAGGLPASKNLLLFMMPKV
jgi:hypothetical protein